MPACSPWRAWRAVVASDLARWRIPDARQGPLCAGLSFCRCHLTTALEPGDIHVWLGEPLPPSRDELALLSDDESARAARFRFDVDRHRFQSARVLLRRVLSRYAERAPGDWHFDTNPWGKPHLAAGQQIEPLHFNVSHSRQHIVCAVARFSDLGIDVEDRVPDDFHELAARFFAPAEADWLTEAGDEEQAQQRFLTIWTLKEAWIKARGTGLSTPLDAFSIVPRKTGGEAILHTSPDIDPCPQTWRFALFGQFAPARLALAYRQPQGLSAVRPSIRRLHATPLLDEAWLLTGADALKQR